MYQGRKRKASKDTCERLTRSIALQEAGVGLSSGSAGGDQSELSALADHLINAFFVNPEFFLKYATDSKKY